MVRGGEFEGLILTPIHCFEEEYYLDDQSLEFEGDMLLRGLG